MKLFLVGLALVAADFDSDLSPPDTVPSLALREAFCAEQLGLFDTTITLSEQSAGASSLAVRLFDLTEDEQALSRRNRSASEEVERFHLLGMSHPDDGWPSDAVLQAVLLSGRAADTSVSIRKIGDAFIVESKVGGLPGPWRKSVALCWRARRLLTHASIQETLHLCSTAKSKNDTQSEDAPLVLDGGATLVVNHGSKRSSFNRPWSESLLACVRGLEQLASWPSHIRSEWTD